MYFVTASAIAIRSNSTEYPPTAINIFVLNLSLYVHFLYSVTVAYICPKSYI